MASFHDPFAIYTLLRFMNKSSGLAGLTDSAVEYRVMASSSCWASAAMSPRWSSFSAQRCLKSEGNQSRERCCVTAQALTHNPFCLLPMRGDLPRQFTIHFVETLDPIRDAIGHFEMFAKSPINRGFRGCKLRTIGVSSQRGTRTGGDTHMERGNQGISPRTACQF